MNIVIKYNVGDVVWYMRSNSPVPGVIEKINVKVNEHNNNTISIEYVGYWQGTQWAFAQYEHSLFPTKQALLNSL